MQRRAGLSLHQRGAVQLGVVGMAILVRGVFVQVQQQHRRYLSLSLHVQC
jgi:hypothetical protein